jgi:large subunit ribosomal protein L10
LGLSLEQKQAMVSEVAAKLAGALAVIVAEYRGLKVDRVSQLRVRAR